VFFLRLALIFTVSLLVFAPITGYIAYNYGRSFWRWFGLGLVLPFVSVFIALFVAMREKYVEEKADEQRRRMPPAA
jgi:MFS family permease